MARIPEHVGIIPDGNRRWAVSKSIPKENAYQEGLAPGLKIFKLCQEIGIKELTFYCFTQDNTKRPKEQTKAFQKATIDAVDIISREDAELLIVGNTNSPMFPSELLPYTTRTTFGSGGTKLNFLVNYGWQWDLSYALSGASMESTQPFAQMIRSSDISRIDLIIRWGGRRRLSGFLPVQSVYSDFYIVEALWPDSKPEHFYDALEWYQIQDITLGG